MHGYARVQTSIYIYTNNSVRVLRVQALRAVRGFQCSGRSERSKSPRARSGPLRAAQNRSEPLRVAQSGRSELFEEPLRVAQSAHRAAQRRSESLGACPEPLRAALNRRARSEPLRACSWPLVRAQSLLKTACALEIDAAVRACSASPLRSNLLFEETVR